MNLARILAGKARRYDGKTAFAFAGKNISFADVDRAVGRFAHALRNLGVGKGRRVVLQFGKSPDFIFLHLANLALGGITVPLNPAYTPAETAYFLADAGAFLFLTDRAGLDRALQAARVAGGEVRTLAVEALESNGATAAGDVRDYPADGDDVAMLCYTSGTTGRPKGAMITHRNLLRNAAALREVWQWTDRDVLLHALPLFHIHGLNVAAVGSLYCGSTAVLHEKFDPARAWATLGDAGCTMFMGVPTMYHRLLQKWEPPGPDLSAMRVFISGSAPLSESLFQRFEAVTGFRILERYGMTEAGMIASNPLAAAGRIPRSVGHPLPGNAVRIAGPDGETVRLGQVGELWIRGESVCRGYWQKPDATAEAFTDDGWFKSGDLGVLDPEDAGRLHLVGRSKEMIISGGFNVYPKEVETALERHEAVEEAAVFGLPDPDFGEKVAAAVVTRPGAGEVAAGDLLALCRERLAGYKCPKEVFFLEALPRNAMGKVQKNLLPEIFSRGVEADA